jgi:predicted Rossmann fold flavoprotein
VSSLIIEDDSVVGVRTSKPYFFDSVIIATGGMSYPLTGSDGAGYALARQAGHTITDISPSLVPIEAVGTICKRMQGLSLKNVGISIINNETNKTVYNDFGEMLFTHFGVSGPMILSASAHIKDVPISSLTLKIDLKTALDEKQLDMRLLSDFEKYANRDFSNALNDLLPSKMIDVVVELSGISPDTKVNSITKAQRKALLSILKGLEIKLSKFRPIDEAIVTSGGVKTTEISPKTMESKLKKNLYFAGEVIDVDAYTGGYNLQIAFSTGYLAATSSAE